MKNFILFFFLMYTVTFAQSAIDDFCTEVDENHYTGSVHGMESILTQTGGLYKPSVTASGEYFRILIVFVQFKDDSLADWGNWSYNSLPTYAYSLVDSVVSTTYNSMTTSDYWKQMSFGNFNFIGDVYHQVVTLKERSFYASKNFEYCNKDVCDSINGKINFNKYDNWSKQGSSFVFNEGVGDGYVDMIYMIFRNPSSTFGVAGGIATLGYNLNFTTSDGKIIKGNGVSDTSSGITYKAPPNLMLEDILANMTHEYGHYLFGGGHTMMSGIMAGVTSYKSETLALSGWERERLGYVAYTAASQDNFTVTLYDFISTGQVLKIPISGSPTSYFLVENHQRLSIYDQITRGGAFEGLLNTSTAGSGIYIWLIKNSETYPPTIDVKTANGNWNWQLVGTINVGGGWPEVMPLSGRVAVNRHLGKSDRHPQNVYWNGWWEKWHDTIPGSNTLSLRRNVMGLPEHAWNYNYNRIFSPWSSPSSYVNGTTNLALQIFNHDGNAITVKVFNTANSCKALPPSRPEWVKGTINANLKPVINWTPNIEPDLLGYRVYKKLTTSSGTMTSFVFTTTTTYTDNDFNVHNPRIKDRAEYWVRAIDSTNQLSDPSSDTIKVVGTSLIQWKEIPEYKSTQEIEHNMISNYPNPFNPNTTIKYEIKTSGFVQIKVFDILGNEVAKLIDESKEVGSYTVNFNASHLPSGIYIYTMSVNDFVQSKKMSLIK